MSNRTARTFALAAVAATTLVAHTAVSAQKAPLQKLGKGEGQVDIVAWAGCLWPPGRWCCSCTRPSP